ncbi:HD domain-containing protein 2 [Lingula anatina]|uniref:5'-deoxynucleotidase HDDC2 n=1 Tax=Lingula anatina TaxID=7574 RepID=A0A1S3JXE3_LINAN|nr:HD domain-containing protein 2 [Lingula anatina]|eukprot:XP_013414709.1 HD domain-containing protein 2 [Lingula anatina]
MAGKVSGLLEFFMVVGRLKRTVRAGWVQRHVAQPESVSDHMYRMAVMTLALGDNDGINRDRCLKLALVHDMAESLVGDITPACGISKEEKHRKEKDAMNHITSLLPGDIGTEVIDLWMEYEQQTSKEAAYVKDIDRFEMILQAYEYEREQSRPGELQDFFDSTKGKFKHQTIQEWVQELEKMRNKDPTDDKT